MKHGLGERKQVKNVGGQGSKQKKRGRPRCGEKCAVLGFVERGQPLQGVGRGSRFLVGLRRKETGREGRL